MKNITSYCKNWTRWVDRMPLWTTIHDRCEDYHELVNPSCRNVWVYVCGDQYDNTQSQHQHSALQILVLYQQKRKEKTGAKEMKFWTVFLYFPISYLCRGPNLFGHFEVGVVCDICLFGFLECKQVGQRWRGSIFFFTKLLLGSSYEYVGSCTSCRRISQSQNFILIGCAQFGISTYFSAFSPLQQVDRHISNLGLKQLNSGSDGTLFPYFHGLQKIRKL